MTHQQTPENISTKHKMSYAETFKKNVTNFK